MIMPKCQVVGNLMSRLKCIMLDCSLEFSFLLSLLVKIFAAKLFSILAIGLVMFLIDVHMDEKPRTLLAALFFMNQICFSLFVGHLVSFYAKLF